MGETHPRCPWTAHKKMFFSPAASIHSLLLGRKEGLKRKKGEVRKKSERDVPGSVVRSEGKRERDDEKDGKVG